eukprot:Protomagalhaensia_sp_Gyna_25__4373@NODE_39_length_6608_cov_168_049018_g28_i0_p3_GENE_NODE_39_length_6608_cov_168_049018_g28_i0NODE_39_length_6608_cov_168_049018_g28_i0_p3_ORF_typecomplete_len319_score53_69Arf/PF00025_21/0_00043Arf/PF00025_21/2_5e22SRPRB/PF09439_10/29SRPRB/PF09439_10/1_2e07Ras/PF00071_22/16Ras/PF00071_22/3_3e05Gtr1_RagA/PF04670_12/13Gtr1_RagA/PF04670_12/0_52GTP_EFTU/PF00009_27/1_9e03GTP_EFTU/PF00009_27/0_055Roc/PF08477_13/3_3Roc/PF08477_13/72_NODE_39_length_6608_cov_168_049018_g2
MQPLTQRIGRSKEGFVPLSDSSYPTTTSSEDERETTLKKLSFMELSLLNLLKYFQPPDLPAVRVVIWGAKRSGKSSIIYRWKLESFIPCVPTVGLLEETHDHFSATTRTPLRLHLCEIGRDPTSVEMKASTEKESDSGESGVSDDDDDDDVEIDGKRPRRGRRRRRRSNRYGRRCCSSFSKCCRCLFCCKRRQKAKSVDFAVKLWSSVVKRAEAVVYVVDSSCKVSLLEMFDDLNLILHNDQLRLQDAKFLILANKQDVWGAVRPQEIERMLNLPPQISRRVKVFGCSALTGENLDAALMWLEESTLNKRSTLQMMTV